MIINGLFMAIRVDPWVSIDRRISMYDPGMIHG
jgi:hypothetical protein